MHSIPALQITARAGILIGRRVSIYHWTWTPILGKRIRSYKSNSLSHQVANGSNIEKTRGFCQKTVSYLSFSPYCEYSVLSRALTQSFCSSTSAGHERLLLNGANFESPCCVRVVVFVCHATDGLLGVPGAEAERWWLYTETRADERALGWWGEIIVCNSHWADLNQGSSCAPLTAILLPKIYALGCRGSAP